MCGIVGIVGKSNVNQALYDALTVLQHRGQDAAGIVTSHGNRSFLRKDNSGRPLAVVVNFAAIPHDGYWLGFTWWPPSWR